MVDHYLVYGIGKINARRHKESTKKVVQSRNMKKYDKTHFRHDLNQIEWETILGPYSSDPVSMAATFQEIFESILDALMLHYGRKEFATSLLHGLLSL